MLLKFFYDENVAHASYLVGCEATKEAVIIDPARHVEQYLERANKEGLKIIGALETHIHADFVSGSRELAERLGATLYVSDEGEEDWKYQNIDHLPHQRLKDGDEIKIGNLTFGVMHTPGHTPESMSFTLTDGGAGADEPLGIFTGDFVFVGDIGRPDLLEKAAGMKGTSESGALAMFDSLQKFKALPDFMQVWPAHGAGSACGKSLGAIPSSTIGYEKRFNWALKCENRDAFVHELLDGQPEPPKYFAVMKHVNKYGTNLLSNLSTPERVDDIHQVEPAIQEGTQVVDTRDTALFARKHVEGTINIPFNKSFTTWAGWLLDYERPVTLLANPEELDGIILSLQSIGIDQINYYMDIQQALDMSTGLESYEAITPLEAAPLVENGDVHLLDVRSMAEWEEGHIKGAKHIMLGTLPDRIDEVPTDLPLVLQCRSGFRSAIGASLLQTMGFKHVHNLTGGYIRWVEEVQIQATKQG